MEILRQWGLEIIFALISAGILGYAKWKGDKLKKELQRAKEFTVIQERTEMDKNIEEHLEPIYEELEDLRKYMRDTANTEKSHMNLIIASYRYRLIQLCKAFLSQGYITTSQMEQLTEFYKVYTGLGGNGAAKVYYDKAINLPTKVEDEPSI
jgi:hypothetical protein